MTLRSGFRAGWAALLCAILTATGCSTSRPPVAALRLTFPDGALSVNVRRDGESRIHYGAMAEGPHLRPGAFELDSLFEQLEKRLRPAVPAEERPPGAPFGTVTIGREDGSSEFFFIYDQAFATDVLRRGCANRLPASDRVEGFYQRVCESVR